MRGILVKRETCTFQSYHVVHVQHVLEQGATVDPVINVVVNLAGKFLGKMWEASPDDCG